MVRIGRALGDRLGMSIAGNAVSNTMEAGLGAIWGEDPRYIRDAGAHLATGGPRR